MPACHRRFGGKGHTAFISTVTSRTNRHTCTSIATTTRLSSASEVIRRLQQNLRKVQGIVEERPEEFWMPGMPTLEPKPGERVKDVRCDADMLTVDLLDGRTISVPLVW